MKLLDSFFDAIVRLEGDSLVMHVGEKPYVVTTSSGGAYRGPLAWGQVELSSKPLSLEFLQEMLAQILSPEHQRTLDEIGAVEHEVTPPSQPAERFTIIVARGGNDIWVEVRRVPKEQPKPEPAVVAPVVQAPSIEPPAPAGVSATPIESPIVAESAAAGEPAFDYQPAATDESESEFEAPYEVEVPAECEATVEFELPPRAQPEEVEPDTPVHLISHQAEDVESPILEIYQYDTAAVESGPVAETPVHEWDRTEHRVDVYEIQAEDMHAFELHEPAPSHEVPPAPVEQQDEAEVEAALPSMAAAAEELPVVDESPGVEEAPAAEELPVMQEAPAAEEVPAVEEVPAAAAIDARLELEPSAAPAMAETLDEGPVASPAMAESLEAEPVAPPAMAEILDEEPAASPPMAEIPEEKPVGAPVLAERAVGPPAAALAFAEQIYEAPAAAAASAAREEADPVAPRAAARPERPVEEEAVPERPVIVRISRAPTELKAPPEVHAPSREPMPIDQLIRAAMDAGGSVLYVVANSRPMVRAGGQMRVLKTQPVVTAESIDQFILESGPVREPGVSAVSEATEWEFLLSGAGRVRCVAFQDRNGPGLILHVIPSEVSTLEQLGLPAAVYEFGEEADGLVIVAGPRSSGKSTLLHALVDRINRTRADHIVTIESRIGFVHDTRNSLVSQREVSGDGEAIAGAARAALREGPDILVIDDLRSPEAIAVAIDAARAGRLILGSIAAPSGTAAVERLIEVFAPARRPQVRALLAGILRGVVTQALVRDKSGARIAARELLLSSPAVRQLVADGEFARLDIAIEAGRAHGMMTLSSTLLALVRDGHVEAAEARRHAPDRDAFTSMLRRAGLELSDGERLA